MPGVYLTPLLDSLYSLTPEEVREPDLPVHIAVVEIKTLDVLANKYKTKLQALNLDWSIVERLVPGANALQEAEIELTLANFGTTELATQWENLYSEAFTNRGKLLNAMDYAFDSNQNLLDALHEIRGGSGYADLVEDEGKLEGYGIKFKHLLDACNIDFNLVKRAGELKILLGDMLAKVDVEKMEKSPEKQLRDRVFTWVDFAVAKIRKCSKTAFFGSDDIITLFGSAYQRKLRQKYERKKATEKLAATAVAS
jgi:hypothetical protein